MYITYVLKSTDKSRYYIGHTGNLVQRPAMHNSGRVKSTKAYIPYSIVYTEEFSTKSEAFKREMQIKSYRHGEAFKKLIQ